MRHPARTIPYDELRRRLEWAKAAKRVSVSYDGDFAIWNYTNATVYERAWDETTMLARGLVTDWRNERVVATPFGKFFNFGERDEPLPDEPFEVFEKLDGSLIILWHDGFCWRTSTRGSFGSQQALAAKQWLLRHPISPAGVLHPGCTYLAEWVGPSNRIVVPYHHDELILLGAYGPGGHEFSVDAVRGVANAMNWRHAKRFYFTSLTDLVAHAAELPQTAEGFVIRFEPDTA